MADKSNDRSKSQDSNKSWPQYDVFVSYAHSDREVAETLARKLRERGLSTFFDRENIRVGEHLSDRLREAIEGSRLCLVIISKKTDPYSPWISREWAMIQDSAWRRSNLSVCPILLDDVPTPTFLQSWQQIRSSRKSQDIEKAAQDIANVIRQSPAERATTHSERDKSITATRFSEIADILKANLEDGHDR
jgi:hypothetical protein